MSAQDTAATIVNWVSVIYKQLEFSEKFGTIPQMHSDARLQAALTLTNGLLSRPMENPNAVRSEGVSTVRASEEGTQETH